MELLIHIIGFACLGHLGADFLSQYESLPDKPFKCNMCFTYWISIIFLIFTYGWNGMLIAAIAAILSELIFKKIS